MHIEVLTGDSSGKALLEHLLPKLIGPNGEPHTWCIRGYRGLGNIPPGMKGGDPARRILLEQTEAWYFGGPDALHAAYPKAQKAALKRHRQDTACGTWEMLAGAVHSGGLAAVRKPGGPRPGDLKHEWADCIGPFMNPNANRSPGFGKLRDGLRRLIAAAADNPAPSIQPGQTPAG